MVLLCLAFCGALGGGFAGCKGGGSAPASDAGPDASSDSGKDGGLPTCAVSPSGESQGGGDGGALSAGAVADDFGPNAVAAKTNSALGRVNLYEITNGRTLERVEIYLATPLTSSRLTIAVHEALSMTTPFRKLADVQVDLPSCVGWASSGPLNVPLVTGRFYAVGFDPNQAVQPFVDSEADDLPVDGHLGRLTGSKTSTSVSIGTLTWDKVITTEFTRQRLTTSPRAEADAGTDAGSDSGSDGGTPGAADSGTDAKTSGPSDAASDAPTAPDGPANDAPTAPDGAANDAARAPSDASAG
jgi:hypothetical protein